MKKLAIIFLSTYLLISCSSVRVVTDYDSKTDFSTYKTFAFYKKGIDKAKISDFDKRRILKAIEAELLAKGFKKSKNPDILVSIFTKSRKNINVDSYSTNYWYPFYYSPFFYTPFYYNSFYFNGRNGLWITKQTEGTLFIDFIDVQSEKLIWQGIGSGVLGAKTGHKKEERIQTFVKEIISKYPPSKKK
tara:strand:+ start:287 stop:853 length:567 start_codon:yes stop_codon:yes gene_type:complete